MGGRGRTGDWKEGFLVKLPKKGDQSMCDNHRGIILLSVPGKVLNRSEMSVNKKLRDNQARFRQGRLCIDQILILGIIIKQSCTRMEFILVYSMQRFP